MTSDDPRMVPDTERIERATLPRGSRTSDEALLQREFERPEFLNTDPWRVLRIMSEFVHGFDTLAGLPPAVTVFGSARTPRDDHYYHLAERLGRDLVHAGFGVITGGGPGIMEAANRGASEAKGLNIGLTISIPNDEFDNPYVSREVHFRFHYFFMRKFWFVYLAEAVVLFPGGFGTLDEFFEMLTLVQTRKIKRRMPIVLFGAKYRNEVLNFEALVRHGTISPPSSSTGQILSTRLMK